MRLPDFLVIGAARCGTTSLFEYLRFHPQIYLPPNKRPEPHFFLREREYKKGIKYYSDKYFKYADNKMIAGELSTSYIYQPYVAGRIKVHLPHVKLIAMLRNPIERAFSNYVVTYNNGIETLSFDEAIRQEKHRIGNPESTFHAEVQPFAYMDRGRYYKQLRVYLQFFPTDQIHIVIFEDFIEDTLGEVQKISKFLDVKPDYIPPNLNERFNANNYGDAVISTEIREYIHSELREDIAELSKLLKRDLGVWK